MDINEIALKLIEAQQKIIELQNENASLKENINNLKIENEKLNLERNRNIREHIINYHDGNVNHTIRDKSRIIIDGEYCLKNKGALKIIKKYCDLNRNLTLSELMIKIPPRIQGGSLWAYATPEQAKSRTDQVDVRYYTQEENIIHLKDGPIYVTTQWTIDSIRKLVKLAQGLGIDCKIDQTDN